MADYEATDDTPQLSDTDTSEDESQDEQVETLVAGRERRKTAGNRYDRDMVLAEVEVEADQEEPDEVALLFQNNEEEEDEEFKSSEGEDDADMSSSDDDDQGPNAAAEDLEGEKELQKQAKDERAKKRKADLALTSVAGLRKKLKTDPTRPTVAPSQAKPSKKKERVTWVHDQDSGRSSLRKQTIAHRAETIARLKESEAQSKKMKALKQQRDKERARDAPKELTQADRLAEAARVERQNAKSLNRWEATERKRQAEQAEKLAALKNRKLDGPVVSWWSAKATWIGPKLHKIGTKDAGDVIEGGIEPKKRGRKPKAYHEQLAAAKNAEKAALAQAQPTTETSSSAPSILNLPTEPPAEPSKEPTQESQKDVSKELPKESTQEAETAKEQPQGPSQEPPKEQPQAPPQEPPKEQAQGPPQDPSNAQPQEPSQEPPKEQPKGPSLEPPQETPKEPSKEQPQGPAQDPSNAQPQEPPKEQPQEPPQEQTLLKPQESSPESGEASSGGLPHEPTLQHKPEEPQHSLEAPSAKVPEKAPLEVSPEKTPEIAVSNDETRAPVLVPAPQEDSFLKGIHEYANMEVDTNTPEGNRPSPAPSKLAAEQSVEQHSETPRKAEDQAKNVPTLMPQAEESGGKEAGKGEDNIQIKTEATEAEQSQVPPNVKPTGAPELPPPPPEHSTRNLVFLEKFDALSSESRQQFSIFYNQRKAGKHVKQSQELCGTTGLPVRYQDPSTGIGFANVTGYKMLQELKEYRFSWSSMLGCYVGREGLVARGVPDGFSGEPSETTQ